MSIVVDRVDRAPRTSPTPVPRRRLSAEQVVGWSVMTAVTLFVVWQVYPDLILRDTTPTNGDLAGHVHEPAFLRDHLLPRGRLSGWSQDWFTGYPSLTFYFPLSSLLIVLLDFLVLPYNVAVKLVSASGAIALPLCAYAFGRLNRCSRPASACLGIAVLPLLLHPGLIAAGGSIGSTTTGEYTYEMSLALGLVVLGLARAGLRTGRHRALTAGLLAATALLHLVPTVAVVIGLVAATALRRTWAALRWTAPVLAVGGALTGFWAVPFLLRTSYTTGPDYPRAEAWATWLYPPVMRPVVLVAAVGVVAMLMRGRSEREDDGDDLGVFLLVMAVVAGALFALTPEGRVWNARYVGVWFLWVGLLAGHALAWAARSLDEARRRRARGRPVRRPLLACVALPVALLAVVTVLWDSRAGGGVLTRDETLVMDPTRLPTLPYEGYEGSSYRDRFQELIDTARSVTRARGCGRAHFQWDEDDWTGFHVPLLWLVPYFTDGCMPVSTGVYPQSSATSPYLDAVNTRLSPEAMSVFRRRPFDAAAGIADLRVLGIRYLLAAGPLTQQAVEALPDVRVVAEAEQFDGRRWKFYEISGVRVVEPLRYTPVVVPGIGRTRHSWEAAADRWFDGGSAREVVAAAGGPDRWPRRDRVSTRLPRRPTADTEVSDVRIGHDRISFRVSRPGVPILVKVSYFPNWQASGAEGPWRVTPNQMVVVPTSNEVTLRYGRTPVEHAGVLVSLGGLGGLVFLARGGLRRRRRAGASIET